MRFSVKQAKLPSDTEMKRLLSVIADERYASRDRFAFMLSYQAGLRVGEIAALKIGDVFNNDGSVKQQLRLNAAITKTNETRAVFLNAKLMKEAERYYATLKYPSPNKPLLPTQKQTAFSANTLCQRFKELYMKAGIDGASSHSGRRRFITQLAHNGISAKVVMTLAGHKNLATTQRYIDVNDEMLKAAVEIL